MRTHERRERIVQIIAMCGTVTAKELATRLRVTPRTILRDIEVLSIVEPIYTQSGRYGGGVYVIDDYTFGRMYMTDRELAVLHKVAFFAENKSVCDLSEDEFALLKTIILMYTKPNHRKGNKYETKGKRIIKKPM